MHNEVQGDVHEYGAQSMISPLVKVLVRSPDSGFVVDNPIKWHYKSPPVLDIAIQEHEQIVNILKQEGVEVYYHNQNLPDLADSVYVHDPVIITEKGAILLQMGKTLRRGEEDAVEICLHQLGIPTYYRLHGQATAEGGDLLWVDEKTLAVGQGFRTNREGYEQLCEALEPIGVTVIPVELPYWEGEESCLHLQSMISLVDNQTALVNLQYLSVPFVKHLQDRGFKLIEVPDEEFMSMGSNVLCIRPGICLTIEGNPITKQRMEEAGIKVYTYKGEEISLKAEGGATCLTRPLLRLW
jgi:dimethylargininase